MDPDDLSIALIAYEGGMGHEAARAREAARGMVFPVIVVAGG